jgi:hypothetical protein
LWLNTAEGALRKPAITMRSIVLLNAAVPLLRADFKLLLANV